MGLEGYWEAGTGGLGPAESSASREGVWNVATASSWPLSVLTKWGNNVVLFSAVKIAISPNLNKKKLLLGT